MQHAVIGVAYCDIFFTADGNQARSIEIARRVHPNLQLAKLCTTSEEFERAVSVRARRHRTEQASCCGGNILAMADCEEPAHSG